MRGREEGEGEGEGEEGQVDYKEIWWTFKG